MNALKVTDKLDQTTTVELINGYFRTNGFMQYGVKLDDFIKIVSNYILEKHLKFGKNNSVINVFNQNRIRNISCLNKNCFVAVDWADTKMFSTCMSRIHIY